MILRPLRPIFLQNSTSSSTIVLASCNAIFKISVRPQHEESFLSGKEKWRFGFIQQGQFGDDLVGDVTSGTLDIVEAIMSGVKTSSKKTDLK